MTNLLSSAICQKCGGCCKNFPFVELSQVEIDTLEKFTGLPSEVFTEKKGETSRDVFLQFKENGDCYFLNEKNGEFSCGVYEARPGLCRSYPSIPAQDKACDANREKKLPVNSGPIRSGG